MHVSYDVYEKCQGWPGLAPDFFLSKINEYSCKRILEIGSGANPTLSPTSVQANGLTYVTSDVSPEELKKADSAFEQMVLDLSVADIDPSLIENFDAIVSRFVAEHISDGHQYHTNLYKMLRPGGISIHCFSTLWCLPFAVNRLLPDFVTDTLLNIFGPRDRHKHDKFKAYYSWGRGPRKKMIRRYQDLGFEVIRYSGYFGHGYYEKRLPLLHRIEGIKRRFLVKYPLPFFCSYATIVLRKPGVLRNSD